MRRFCRYFFSLLRFMQIASGIMTHFLGLLFAQALHIDEKLILLFNANYFNIFPFMSVQNMFNQIFVCVFFLFSSFLVSRLMGGSASGSMGHMGNMGSLAACSVSDSKPMQFPLAQRRKRRVLFTQAQVCPKEMLIFILVYSCSCDLLFYMS